MRVIRGIEAVSFELPTVVAIGAFDGVHLGHQALIKASVADAGTEGSGAVVFTFDRHPLGLIASDRTPKLLTSLERRAALIAEMGVDALVMARFDEALRDMPPQVFVERVLGGALRARSVWVGDGFAFGRGRAGTTSFLRDAGQAHGFRTHVMPTVEHLGEPVSSSRIRGLILAGEVEAALALLGRPHMVSGVVEPGEGLGRQIGFPTANLRVDPSLAIPCDGVYATLVSVDGQRLAGACSIGSRPTVGGSSRVFEVHLLDSEADLYGAVLEVRFLARLRGQVRYGSVAELVAQMRQDVVAVRGMAEAHLAGQATRGGT